MELLIERALWQPDWAQVLQAWQRQGHRWQLLLSKEAESHLTEEDDLWSTCRPDGLLSATSLLAAWLDGDLSADPHLDPSCQILISASPSLLTLAKESGLLTLGPLGADLVLTADDDMGAVLNRLLARRLTVPLLREPAAASSSSALVLRPLLADDEAEVVRYCGDEALSRYTLNIPHPYPPEGARDWLVGSWRKAALGLGWSWAMTLPQGDEVAPLVGVISLHWNGELAWWVGVPWQNQGLATRAAQRVKSFAFDTLQLPALTARHMPGNLASGRVMAKLGMHYRGLRGRTAQQPCEVSYWRLDRAISLPEPVTLQLAPWLADERVAVAILQGADAQTGLDHGRPWQLTLFLDEQGYDPDLPGVASDDGAWLDVICYPLSELDLAEPERLPLLGGVLLKDRDEQGLACLLQLASLRRQGPVLLTRAQRQQRLGWIGKMARRAGLPATGASAGDAVAGRYRLLWLLVELPALIDELAGHWHQGPEHTLARLEQDDAELFAAYREAIDTLTPAALLGLLRQLAARFPESTLPFLDKGAQAGRHFVE
ncbi:GNAT family N-acetyltransferase [Aeromonas piscicola]|uniref:GNAT family N-acetyltransferase n=1 Tax=Aeromonas piscicola TaxID=600645 RepID=UPI0009E43B79|nr:GNAT family N-acetyltransferase [Aeromonas piscicola]